jgi:predicted nucleic acid-binding protein
MQARIYVETSVISYLTNRPSKDEITLGRQLLTQQWWQEQAQHYQLLCSSYVTDELSRGNPEAASRRLAAISHISELDTALPAIDVLADALIQAGALPSIARLDALHIATCSVHGIELLLTWNFTHIANPHKTRLVEQVCRKHGFQPALLVSPDQLLQTDSSQE